MADRHCTERALSCAELPDADLSIRGARISNSTARPSAYHEAAHAVVALALGAELQCVEIFPDGSGVTRVCWSQDATERALILFAGTIAEARYRKRSPWEPLVHDGSMHDWLALCALAGSVSAETDSSDDPLEEWERAARAAVRRCWAAISRVAAVLCARGRLSGAEVSELVQGAQPCHG
jgi:hypothetical protein